MMIRWFLAALAAICLFTGPAQADAPDEFTEIKAGMDVDIRPDRAYLLFRIPRYKGAASLEPLLMRIPTADENARYDAAKKAAFAEALPKLTKNYQRALEKYERKGDASKPTPLSPSIDRFPFVWDEVANLSDVDFSDAFVKTKSENTYLVEAPAGDYVLYGMSPSTGLPRMVVCFCLGTVGFSAKAGTITDLGYVIGDFGRQRSVVPELADETGFGPSSDVGIWVITSGTVRAARSDSSMPLTLDQNLIEAAQYRAIGRYFTPNAAGINRLVPVPGVLEYDGRKVIDVQTGEVVPDNL